MPRARLSVFLLPILLLCAAFTQDPTDRVIAEAQKPSALETNLQLLTDQIGGRVPGTPAMRKAVEWGFAAFKDAGASLILLGFLHFQEEVEYFGRHVIPLVRELEAKRTSALAAA